MNDTSCGMDLIEHLPLREPVMSFLQKIEETFNSGDPEVRTWFLIRHTYAPFLLSLGYVAMSILGPKIMRNRKPFDLRKPMIIFNFCIVFTYVTALFAVAYYLPKIPWEMFCRGGLIKKGDPSYLLATIAWVAYLLKYIEFFDTVFFILRKKENLITFLHVMHHATVPLMGWIVFRTEKSALQSIPALMNAMVHVVMYSYYGLAAMGPKIRKYLWWKKYLTQLQIVQFCLIICFVMFVAPFSGCAMVTLSYIMDIIFAPLFLYLFYQFYKTRFAPMKKVD